MNRSLFSALFLSLSVPLFSAEKLDTTQFSGPELTPSPACLAVGYDGAVYVGVDTHGSLKVAPEGGRIVKLIDSDNDGKADAHTVFAKVDAPRGLIAMGDDVFVIHSIFKGKEIVGVDLSKLTDSDHDGVADGPPQTLIKGVSTQKTNNERGVDHSTNGIAMGIDGWIYIAVGDFGFVDATDTSGNKLTQLGGGILRVRPDGTEMEVYTHGMRNIYDMAIDPFMNIFTRGNTNDGGGWNVRFIHHIQSGEYGYPLLYMHFTEEIIPALVDLGGGSGTGAMFLDEPTWPEEINKNPLMCDWGKRGVFIHPVKPDGPTFTQSEQSLTRLSQPTDIGVDGSGRIYVAEWAGAGYKGNAGKGLVQRITPKDWVYKPSPDIKSLKPSQLVNGVGSNSAVARLAAQQELLHRKEVSVAPALLKIASDKSRILEARVAAIFTYKQLIDADANQDLAKLAYDPTVREWALRALADRLPQIDSATQRIAVMALRDPNPRVQAAAVVALGRANDPSVAGALVKLAVPPPHEDLGTREGPHATPNPQVIIPHLAIHALVRLNAIDTCLDAIGSESTDGALRALQLIREAKVVDGLITKYRGSDDDTLKGKLLKTLARLYAKEAPYDGSWWWKTRPDTRGPLYVPVKWHQSEKIAAFFDEVKTDANAKQLAALQKRYRWEEVGAKAATDIPTNTADALVGDTPIEDVVIYLGSKKGDPEKGKKLPLVSACIQCHSLTDKDGKRGPDLNDIGKRLTYDEIADSILRPDAAIAASWVDIILNDSDQTTVTGTLVSKDDKEVIVRDIAGAETIYPAADVKEVVPATSTDMLSHLADGLTVKQFDDLVAYLSSLK